MVIIVFLLKIFYIFTNQILEIVKFWQYISFVINSIVKIIHFFSEHLKLYLLHFSPVFFYSFFSNLLLFTFCDLLKDISNLINNLMSFLLFYLYSMAVFWSLLIIPLFINFLSWFCRFIIIMSYLSICSYMTYNRVVKGSSKFWIFFSIDCSSPIAILYYIIQKLDSYNQRDI